MAHESDDATGVDDTVKLDHAIVLGDPSFPRRFGRYHVQARIGVGGFATVYSAVDPTLEAPVAIKVLAENHSAEIETRRRFMAEARVARRLGSERLIGVFDLGQTDDGRPFVVMELADRGTLRARMARLGPARAASLLRLVDELAACLDAIHGKGVVHRDIKPTNLLLRSVTSQPAGPPDELIRPDERLVLADFGLARDISSGASGLTLGGGTAGYMAPEQADPDGRADFRADIYAATVVVAEVATGRHPERLDLATAPLTEAARDALSAGMAFDRDRRPRSAREWRDQLMEAFALDGPTSLLVPEAPTTVAPRPDLTTPFGSADPDPDPTHRPADTLVQAPWPYNRDAFDDDSADVPARTDGGGPVASAATGRDRPTLVPPEDLAPRTFVSPPADDTPPPPPPSLPQDPARRPPPPAPVANRSTPSYPGYDDPAPDRFAPPPPNPSPPRTIPAPASTTVTPAPSPPLPTAPPPPVATPTTSALPPAPATSATITRPPAPAAALTSATIARPPAPAAPATTPRSAGAAPVAPPPPPLAPVPLGPVPSSPCLAPPRPSTLRPAPPAQLPPPPASAVPVTPPLAPSLEPAGPSAGPGEAEIRSRRHMKTAHKLAKLEQRQSRKLARRRRRRRRFLALVNLILALIRGLLAAGLTFIGALLVLADKAGVEPSQVSQRTGQQAVSIAVVAFFLGIVLFPWPRSIRD